MTGSAQRFHVVTGGPGSGKTTLLLHLRERGIAISDEAGRGVIQEEAAAGGQALPWLDKAAFARRMFDWELRSRAKAEERENATVFDGALPDIVGYLRLEGLDVPADILKAARSIRYSERAFIAPPWPEIYRRDVERRQSLDEAERTFEAMVTTYEELGYRLLHLPRAGVAARAQFLLAQAGLGLTRR